MPHYQSGVVTNTLTSAQASGSSQGLLTSSCSHGQRHIINLASVMIVFKGQTLGTHLDMNALLCAESAADIVDVSNPLLKAPKRHR
jgi:hypothetical protein